MPYILDGELFSTKADITARCRRIMKCTVDGERVAEESLNFLLELFLHHSEWPQKAAGGVSGISTQTTTQGTRCFVLLKDEGASIDISFPHAIRLIPSSRSTDILPQPLIDFRNAARNAVSSQTRSFRDSELRRSLNCPCTGETLNRNNSAVDHVAPKTFDQLLYDFCRRTLINPLNIEIGSVDGTVAVIADDELRIAWEIYHKENAVLRLISKIENLQLTKTTIPWNDLWSSTNQ